MGSSDDTIKVMDADAASKGGPLGAVVKTKIKVPFVKYTYIKGEVTEYISNPASFVTSTYKDTDSGETKPLSEKLYSVSNEEVDDKLVDNSSLARFMPANSIFVHIDGSKEQPVIAYPFFPSHFVLPLKVGERVWLLVEERGPKNFYYYWMCRVAGDRQSEDLNMTTVDRGRDIRRLADVFATTNTPVSDENLILPALTPEKFANPSLPKNHSVSALHASSVSFRQENTLEPVPRTFGKSSDLLLQGSNNTTIQLTTEKFRSDSDISEQHFLSSEGTPGEGNVHTPLAGTIDLFVGKEKSRLRDLSSASDPEAASQSGQFNVRLSKRLPGAQSIETYEASKIDEYVLGKENSKEGDDSPRNVYARLYLGMNATPDNSFEFKNDDFGGPTGNDKDEFDQPRHATGSSAVLYGDHIRSFAEKSLRLHVYPPDSSQGEKSPDVNKDNPGGALLDISNDGTITLQTGQGANAAKLILRSDGNIVIKPGAKGLLHLGGDETESSGIAVSVNSIEGPIAPGINVPQAPAVTDTFGGTSFLGNPGSGFVSSKVVIKI